ncbi:helix-turn-helix domain-containing protein [Kordia sp.]|uniref:helix-turn-helix domain-containing protein n=1 Tax=Kordia sp. TaxID=1965332 RepID=UPI003B5B8F0E
MTISHRFKQWSIHITCILLYCFTTTVLAQNTDKVKQFDAQAFEQSLEGKPFDELLDIFYDNKEVDTTKASLTVSYLKANFLNSEDKVEEIETYLAIATWRNKENNLAVSLANLDIVIQKATAIGNKNFLYQAYNKKGAYYFERGKNEEALENFLIALELAKQTNDLNRQIATSGNIILIKIQARDNLGAIELYLENLKRIESSDDGRLIIRKLYTYLGLTKAYINLENYNRAILYCQKGLKISKEVNLKDLEAYFKTFLGEIASNNGDFEKAYNLFDDAKKLIEEAGGNINLDIFLKLYIGKTYYLEEKYEKAIREFLEGERLLQENEVDFLSIQELYVGLAESYLAIEDIENSTKYFKKAKDIDSENDKTRAIINSRITQDSLNKLKEQINSLEKKSQQTKYLYIFGIVFLFLVIISLIVYYKQQQRKNKKRFNTLISQLEEKRQQEKLQKEKPLLKETSSSRAKTPSEKTKKNIKEQIEIDGKTAEILKKLEEFEAKELFLSQESTLVEVAKKIQTNTTYLSKVINTHKEKSFTAYITDLRVDYAIERLSIDRKFRSFTIGAIAQEIGFKRSESFSKAFKVKTGLYPSYFIKELEKQ